jgi:holo-[acyl-carrier protein] synthase
MLEGVEVALVSVVRFRRATERHGRRLLERVFSPAEIAYAARRRDGAHSLAARFAAKCAGRRALLRLGVAGARWRDLEVVRRKSGEPSLRVGEDATRRVGGRPLVWSLSLTHDPDWAAAMLLVEREEGA